MLRNVGFSSPSEGMSGCGWPAPPDSLHPQLLQKELKITSSLAPGALGSPGNDLLSAREGFISSWNWCLWIFLKRKINPFYHNIAIFLNDRTSIFIHLVLPAGESIGITSFSLDLLMSWHRPLLALEPRQGRCSETWIHSLYPFPFSSPFIPLLPSSIFQPSLPSLLKVRGKGSGKHQEVQTKIIPLSSMPAWIKYLEAQHICGKSFPFFFSSHWWIQYKWNLGEPTKTLKISGICHTFGKLCNFF